MEVCHSVCKLYVRDVTDPQLVRSYGRYSSDEVLPFVEMVEGVCRPVGPPLHQLESVEFHKRVEMISSHHILTAEDVLQQGIQCARPYAGGCLPYPPDLFHDNLLHG